jgi:hypothetical protein
VITHGSSMLTGAEHDIGQILIIVLGGANLMVEEV